MKVLVILDSPFVSDSRVEKEIETMLNKGFQVQMICENVGQKETVEYRDGLTIYRRLQSSIYARPISLNYRNYIKKEAMRAKEFEPDIVICHDFQMLPIGMELKKIRPSIVLCYDSHEYLRGWPYYKDAITLLNRVKGWFVWSMFKYLESKAITKCDKVITVSDGICKRLKKVYSLKESPMVLRNVPLKSEYLYKDKEYFKRKYHCGNRKIIVHAGNIYMKDEELILFAKYISESENYCVVFMGDNLRFQSVKGLLSSFNNIYFHDYFDQKKNIEIMAAADIGFCFFTTNYLSHKITSTNRYMEYVHAALPVLSTYQDQVEHYNSTIGNTLFFEDVKALIILLETMDLNDINDPELVNRKNQFHWELEVSEFVAFLGEA